MNAILKVNKCYKPHFMIEISNNITLIQRKAFNVLFKSARPLIEKQNNYFMPVAEISMALGVKNDNQLKIALEGLQRVSVKWNIFDDKGIPEFGSASLLPEVRIKDGMCRYWLADGVREFLSTSPRYTLLDLEIQKHFLSKHSQVLWEFCHEYVNTSNNSTGWKTIQEWKIFFGIKTGQYSRFKDFNNYVIQKAITELNKVSDIRVNAEYRKDGRSVSDIRFRIKSAEKIKIKELKEGKNPLPKSIEWYDAQGKTAQSLLRLAFRKEYTGDHDQEIKDIAWKEFLRRERDKDLTQGRLF